MSISAYLDTLNPQQRRAVEHGVQQGNCLPGSPLLIIAGAGSGKTTTLAHRVAHLVVNGADPRRILLLSVRTSGRRGDNFEPITNLADDGRFIPLANIRTDSGWTGWRRSKNVCFHVMSGHRRTVRNSSR